MRFLIFVFMLLGGTASADVIRWGNGGSIFGGTKWEVTPNDRVVFSGYLVDGAVTARPEWVWTNKALRVGQITFSIKDAYVRAARVVEAMGDPGAPPPYLTECTDAGQSSVAVNVPGLAYDVSVDNCIRGSKTADADVKRHYAAVLGVQKALRAELGLDKLLAP